MRWTGIAVALLAGVAAGLGIGAWRWGRAPAGAPSTGEGRPGVEAPSPVPIEVGAPTKRDVEATLPWLGRVESAVAVDLVALEAGRVASIPASDEAPVRAGAILFTLRGPRIAAAEARFETKGKALAARLDLARKSAERARANLEAKLATQEEVAAAQDEVVRLEAEHAAARQGLDALKERSVVKAPIAGIFTDRRVSEGQEVEAGALLGRIVDPAHLRVVATLYPPEGAALEGKDAAIRLVAGRQITAPVTRVLPRRSPSGATVVWLEGRSIDRALGPGETVGGTLTLAARRGSITVPASAVVYDRRERACVFVRRGERYERRPVRAGASGDGWVEILEGIGPGDRIVTQGAYELFHRDFGSQFKVED